MQQAWYFSVYLVEWLSQWRGNCLTILMIDYTFKTNKVYLPLFSIAITSFFSVTWTPALTAHHCWSSHSVLFLTSDCRGQERPGSLYKVIHIHSFAVYGLFHYKLGWFYMTVCKLLTSINCPLLFKRSINKETVKAGGDFPPETL